MNWLTRVGIDVHIRDRYFIVGRVPVIALLVIPLAVLFALWEIGQFLWARLG